VIAGLEHLPPRPASRYVEIPHEKVFKKDANPLIPSCVYVCIEGAVAQRHRALQLTADAASCNGLPQQIAVSRFDLTRVHETRENEMTHLRLKSIRERSCHTGIGAQATNLLPYDPLRM